MSRPPAPLPPALRRLAVRQAGLVSLRQCAEHGVPADRVTRAARSGRWRRVARGVYDVGADVGTAGPADLDRYDARRRRAAVLGVLAHPGAVATGLCALVLQGVRGAPVDVRPEVTFPDGSAREAATPVRVRRLPLRRWTFVDGLPCCVVEDALAQAVPCVDRRHAVALMDSALHRRTVSSDGLARAHDAARGRPGVERTHRWWSEADARSESPAETWARLTCADAGVPPDTLQLVVVDRQGRFLARVDLAWFLPDGRALLVEVDGQEVHSRPEALFDDRARQNRIVTGRTVVRRYTGRDAWRGSLAAELTQLLGAAGWRRGRTGPEVFAV